jgi:hypothetical protein
MSSNPACPLEHEYRRICLAICHYASHAPLKSPREIQRDLFAICGEPHAHVASIGSDACDLCRHDLRHEIHLGVTDNATADF